MSSCTSAEIAEKKRIALERLAAKKSKQQQQPNPTNDAPFPKSSFYGTATTTKPKPSTSYKSVNATSTSAHDFLNTLKQSGLLNGNSKEHPTRNNSHPYQRPTAAQKQTSPLKSHLRLSPVPMAPIFNKSAVTCKLQLISPQRFSVDMSGFNQQIIDVFKNIPSRNYDTKTKMWSFAVKDYQQLQKHVQPLKPTVVMGAIPKSVLKLCMTPPRPIDSACLASIESVLADKLLPFQRDGVCFAIAQHGRVMICDEMGLGKTYQALAIADFFREDWPLLICTTASTRESWASHVRELLPSVPVHYVQVLTNNQQYFGDAKVLVTSYNMMERHGTQLFEHNFKFLIFDESHALKNSKAKCTSVADRLATKANRVVLLSGTPALSRPVELFSQLQMVDRQFMSFMEYTSRYCDGKQSTFGWDANGQSNLEELNIVLRMKFMIRRVKADVLPQMAEKFRETVVLDPALVWTNTDSEESLAAVGKQFSSSKGREREEILLKFYARTAEVKTKAVCGYLKNLLKENIKFIVFAHHRVMLDAISNFLMKASVNFVRIDGSTKNETRAEYIDTFQKKSSCKVAVLSLKACNSGITLTAAEIIVFAELDWNPSTLAQAESRAHRIGQQKPVSCRYLMAAKTADDYIWNMLKSKQDVLNRAGIFSENLQEATHTMAPTNSQSIESFFSPAKKPLVPPTALTVDIANGLSNTKLESIDDFCMDLDNMDDFVSDDKDMPSKAVEAVSTVPTNVDLRKELDNIDAFFMDESLDVNDINLSGNRESAVPAKTANLDLNKELENIDELFKDDDDDAFFNDDDDAFKDLVY